MTITDIRATTVSVPLEAPLRHANGVHPGRFVRTLVEVESDEGLVGLGEMGGGGESAEAAFQWLKSYLVGHDVFELEALRFKIMNPTAGLYNNRTQLHAAIEFACLDLIGQKLGVPVHALLGGKLRDRVPFASYLFFRYPDEQGAHAVTTPEEMVRYAKELRDRYGFRTHKLADAFPEDHLRYDPNGVLSVEEAVWFGRHIQDCRNDYLEDPTWGLNGMRQVRARLPGLLLATNTVVVDFEQLAANVRDPAVDVILLDTTFWGGIRACQKAAQVCETFQMPVAVHSSGELGVQLATMLHLGATLPALTYAIDAHYHHLRDDVIEGGKLPYEGGTMRVPDEPGLGVRLDREKVKRYHEEFLRLGAYQYDRDPRRPAWYPLVPNTRWAIPGKD
jgi:glucarate dehydratase